MSAFTAKSNDWVIKYTQLFPTRQEAMRREKEIKNKKSRK
jgi:putative endonuclease